MDDLVAAEHLAVLGELVQPLQEVGADVRLIPASDDVPLATLLVLADDAEPRWVNISVLPFDESASALGLVQIYAPLMPTPEQPQRDELARLCTLLAAEAPLGSFGLTDDDVYYRYMLTLRRHGRLDVELTIELIALVERIVTLFGPTFRQVAQGTLSAAEGLEHARERLTA